MWSNNSQLDYLFASAGANWNIGCGHSYCKKLFNALHNPQPLLKISRNRTGSVVIENSVGDKKALKTYKNLFTPMLLPETVCKCALNAADGKLHRPEVMRAFKHFDETYDYVVKCAKDPNYQPCEDNKHEIIDGANHKPREIEKPMFCPEQILHHMIVEPFKPVPIRP